MKNNMFGLGLIFVTGLLTQAASAQVYVGVDLGKLSKGDSPSCFACRSGTSIGKLNLGYDINQDFAVEAGVFKSSKSNSGDKAYMGWGTNDIITVNMDTKISGFQLAGIVKKEFSNGFGGYLKLGVSHVKLDMDYKESRQSNSTTSLIRSQHNDDATRPMLALGLNYKINSNLSARAEFETVRMKRIGENNIDSFTLGLQYKF
jgi:opacity protein-like surface antigen